MSRAQQGQVDTTASGENSTYNTNAQDAFGKAQGDIGTYDTTVGQEQGDVNSFANEVAGFKAANPYVQGGAVQTAQDQETADTAAGLAQSAGQGIQGAAVRTGQNAGGAIAGTESMQQEAQRQLVGQEAGNTASRAAAGAGYAGEVVGDVGKTAALENSVVGDVGKGEEMQDQLAQQQGQLAQGALGTEEEAAKTPSFLDELGQGLITTASKIPIPGCWIAAELFGGWDDARTIVVREWIFGDFRARWYGRAPVWLYLRFGERVAAQIRVRNWLRAPFLWLFEKALRAAGEAVNDGR